MGDYSNSPTPHSVTIAKKPQVSTKSPALEVDHLNWLFVKWLLESSLPTSTLAEKWLTNTVKLLNPSFELWNAEKFHTMLHEVFRSMQETVRLTLEQVSSKVSITLDSWTSYQQVNYMSVSCQWIDENWSFRNVLLDICHIPSPYGSSEIYYVLLKVLRLYNLETKILSCTLKGDMDSQKLAALCCVPCAAHTLNSIVNDGLRSTDRVIMKIREFVMELNASPEITEDFVQFTTAYHEGSWKFPLDASARWSGNYQMLDIARKVNLVSRHYQMLDSTQSLNLVDNFYMIT